MSNDRALECFNRLLELIKTGRLDDELRENFMEVAHCVFVVMLALGERLEQLLDHDHDKPVIGDNDGCDFDPKIEELASALGVSAPAEANGAAGSILVKLLLPLLIDHIADLIRSYLSKDA